MAETMNLTECIGRVQYILYDSPNSDYKVAKIQTSGASATIAGPGIPDKGRLTYRFLGEVKNTRYGQTMYITSAEVVPPTEKSGVIEYLSSKLFKGIGKKTAEKIYEVFGEKTLDIIETDPQQLLQVKKIGQETVNGIIKSLEEAAYLKKLTQLLLPYGITADQCAKIAGEYGKTCGTDIEKNPYLIMKPLRMGFREADFIALQMGIDPSSETRIRAAFRHLVNVCLANGDTGMPLQAFGAAAVRLLSPVPESRIVEVLTKAVERKEYQIQRVEKNGTVGKYIFPAFMVNIETELAANLVRIRRNEIGQIKDIDGQIAAWEKANSFAFDPIQKAAIRTSLTAPLSCISGPPGTGKTTLEKCIAEIYQNSTGRSIILLASTGKAARRIEEVTGLPAKTVHSFLGLNKTNEYEQVDLDPEAENMMIIVDECSMVDTFVAKLLAQYVGAGTTLVLVGDPEQLPSVGAGAVLRDILASGVAETTVLDKVFRTSDNVIYNNVNAIRNGVTELETSDRFRIHRAENLEDCRDRLISLYEKRVQQYGIDNVMLLIPYRKNSCGVNEMNRILQERLNPAAPYKMELKYRNMVFRQGDPVMHILKNTEDASNGDTGTVKGVVRDGSEYTLVVTINGKDLEYSKADLECLDLAYATTVHKSQGSEAKAVIFAMMQDFSAMIYRNIPYVAISRAKQEVDVVCDSSLGAAIGRYISNNRDTLLPRLLKKELGGLLPV